MFHRIMQSGAVALLLGTVSSGAVLAQERLVLAEQGSFSVGGRIVTAPGTFDPTIPGAGARNDGQSFWIDQLYTQYQVPLNARRLPIVMIHGGAGTGRVWETTPDGREGFQTIFVRRGFPVYVVDFPRRGRASIPSFIGPFGDLSGTQIIPPTTFAVGNHQAFLSWRLGPEYPNLYPNSQFPEGDEALEQFLQSTVPIFSDDAEIITDAIIALLDRIGPAILMTHSQSGIFGWLARIRSPKVKGIITFEGGYVFPTGEVPDPLPRCNGDLLPQGTEVSRHDFRILAGIPILVVYGDNQPTCPEPNLIRDGQQLRPVFGRNFVDALNQHGGRGTFVWTPEIGIHGNTHFLFLDKNNLEIADIVSKFLRREGLDTRRSVASQE